MKKDKCSHFWELYLPSLEEDKKPLFKCMHCGKTKRDDIPILDPKIFEGDK